ncbi:MAG: TIGR02206 family membrane protein [Akkermansiaceae bacterium]
MDEAFILYGRDHIGALVALLLLSVVLILSCRRSADSLLSRSGVAILAFCALAAYPINQLAYIWGDTPVTQDNLIPLHLCDLAAFLGGLALLTRKNIFCELCYFWGLAGTLQGLLTPNLAYGFPHPVFISFFLQHGVIVIIALLLPLGLGWVPEKRAPLRAMAWLLAYAAVIYLINLWLGTNFAFLMHKPAGASLLDVMGPAPIYIIWLILLAGVFFVLLDLPFRRSRHRQK